MAAFCQPVFVKERMQNGNGEQDERENEF